MAANLPERIERCPMRVRGTRVVAAPTAGGAALTFTTEGDVRELRARVREMAARHDRVMASGHRGTGVMHGQIGMPPARATVVDVEGGARLVFTPTDGAQADELRAAARRHAQRMQGGECPMESATTL
jgi:hypothetical protein